MWLKIPGFIAQSRRAMLPPKRRAKTEILRVSTAGSSRSASRMRRQTSEQSSVRSNCADMPHPGGSTVSMASPAGRK